MRDLLASLGLIAGAALALVIFGTMLFEGSHYLLIGPHETDVEIWSGLVVGLLMLVLALERLVSCFLRHLR